MSKKSIHFWPASALLTIFLLSGVMGPAAWGVEYTENLWEITEEGLFDEFGNPVKALPPLSPAEGTALPGQPEEQKPNPGDSFETYRETIMNNWGGQRAYTQKRLEAIKESLKQELRRFESLGDQIGEAEIKLNPLEQEIKTLTDQVNLFNDQIRLTREKISKVELQVAEKQLTMRDLLKEIQKSKIALSSQKKTAVEYIRLLYDEESQFVDLYSEGASTLKLLLADRSVSENLMGREYLSIMERTGREVFHTLEEKYLNLREKEATLLLSQAKLSRLYRSLDQEKEILEETRGAKKDLLEKTQEEKETYESLLEESIRQQLESSLAIQNMKDNLEFIEGKLQLLDEKWGIESPAEESSAPRIPVPDSGEPEMFLFDWPVRPRAITAYFHDEHYPKRWGIHNAVDIRASQFTEIRAPANGYVVEAKDNGMGYSYIILAHKKNLVTVYGHVYEILVRPGMLVRKGDVIGLTGGTPGTRGAGLQTTGPHLHFEVHERGEPKNPLDYLPIYELPIEYVPEEYLMKKK